MTTWAFEDFFVGQIVECGSRTVTADEIIGFATAYDPQPFHVDAEAARGTIYGSLIASGWHTVALAMRMACDAYLLDSSSAGSPGVDEVRWLRPVRAGDTIRLSIEMTEVRASASKPDRGIVKTRWQLRNQDDALAMSLVGTALFLRRASL